jgi:hypothetical protein
VRFAQDDDMVDTLATDYVKASPNNLSAIPTRGDVCSSAPCTDRSIVKCAIML